MKGKGSPKYFPTGQVIYLLCSPHNRRKWLLILCGKKFRFETSMCSQVHLSLQKSKFWNVGGSIQHINTKSKQCPFLKRDPFSLLNIILRHHNFLIHIKAPNSKSYDLSVDIKMFTKLISKKEKKSFNLRKTLS